MRLTSLPENIRDYLAKECLRVAHLIRLSDDNLVDASFYLSAAWAAAQRALNVAYTPELAHVYVVLFWVHREVASRVDAIQQGAQPSVRVHAELFARLADELEQLSQSVSSEEDCDEILVRLSALGYSASANGYYLAVSQGDILEGIDRS